MTPPLICKESRQYINGGSKLKVMLSLLAPNTVDKAASAAPFTLQILASMIDEWQNGSTQWSFYNRA